MITDNTLFVTGAGASMCYGFPSGKDLVTAICSGVGMQPVLDTGSVTREAHNAFKIELRESGYESIDSFLSKRGSSYSTIGKIAIAAVIREKERSANLFDPKASDSWLRFVGNAMDAEPDIFATNTVRFITFNYDRTIEHYLTRMVARRHGFSFDRAWNIVKPFSVVHVHGDMGPYDPAQGLDPDGMPVTSLARDILDAAMHVRIIGEQTDQDFRAAITKHLRWATRIIYLGFGYSPENSQIVLPETHIYYSDGTSVQRKLYGTALGLLHEKLRRAKSAIGGDVNLHNCDCVTLLDVYMNLASA